MAQFDSSAYTLRFNEVSQTLEYAANGQWYPISGIGGITQLTGVVTAGPGTGSQVTTFSSTAFVFNEIPSGAVDGTNTVFTLAHTPDLGTVRVYRNGDRQNPNGGADYTISGSTITFAAAPVALDTLLVDYNR